MPNRRQSSPEPGEAPDGEDSLHLWCHACAAEISRPDRVLECPVCGGDFVEEITDETDLGELAREDEDDEEQDEEAEDAGQGAAGADPGLFGNLLMQSLAQVLGPNAQIQFTTTGPATQTFTFNLNPNQPLNQPPNQNPVQGAAANPATPPGNVNPQEILNSILGNPQSLLQRLFSSMGMVGNPGDYAFGREFDDIVTQLMEQSGGNAPPPAPEDAIKGLPRIEVGKEKSEGMPCSICQEPFEIGTKVPKLPCGHIFHEECNEAWLKVNGTCPICRFRLVPEQQNESSSGGTATSTSASAVEGQSNAGTSQP